MIKLKTQKVTTLVHYQQFLKNNCLKKKKLKLKDTLFENEILYKNKDLNAYAAEFNKYGTIYLPFTLKKRGEIASVNRVYENIILFNYELTNNVLLQFNKVMFSYIFQKKKDLIIQGRLIRGVKKRQQVFIAILGRIFGMKTIYLNTALDYRQQTYQKRNFRRSRIKPRRLINSYKLRYLNFKINRLTTFQNSCKELSRVDYVKLVLENKKILNQNLQKKKNKKFLSKKTYSRKKKF